MRIRTPNWIDLKDGESIRLMTHPSKWLLFQQFAYILVAIAIVAIIHVTDVLSGVEPAGIPLEMASLALIPLFALPFVKGYILRQFIVYVITDTRLYKKTGIISRKVDPFKIDQLVDIDVSEGALDRVLGKGEVLFANAAAEEYDMIWEDVAKPHKIHSMVERAQDDLASEG